MASQAEGQARFYESVVILHPDVTEAEQKKFFQRNGKTIQEHAGRVNHIDTWGKRRLSAPINKVKLGTYFHTTFEANTSCVAELERIMKIDERVLRFAHVRLDERRPIAEYVEEFHTTLAETHKREQEHAARRDARRSGPGGGGGGRPRFRRDDDNDGSDEE
jgi:small subunit ribosomal protein S6